MALILVGAAVTGFGVHVAATRRRPASLGGALLAPTGLLLAYRGALLVLGVGS